MVMRKNNKGWIKVVEAVIAVLLVATVLIIVASRGSFQREEISQRIYSVQVAILKEIQQNDSLREAITAGGVVTPVDWENFEEQGLGSVKQKIISRTPDYLVCEAKVCDPDDLCDFTGDVGKDIYAYSIVISASESGYNPRQIKLFCWT
jgi:hypothetical protein